MVPGTALTAYAAWVVVHMTVWAITTLNYPLLLFRLDATTVQIAILLALPPMLAPLDVVFGWVADRWRRRGGTSDVFLVAGVACVAVGMGGLASVRTLGTAGFFMALCWVGVGVYRGPALALLSQRIPASQRTGAMSRVTAIRGITALVFFGVLPRLGPVDTALPYAIAAGVAILAHSLLHVGFLRRVGENRAGGMRPEALSPMGGLRRCRHFFGSQFLWWFGVQGVIAYFALFAVHEIFGITDASAPGADAATDRAALAMALVALASIVAAPMVGALVRRFDSRAVLIGGLAVMGLADVGGTLVQTIGQTYALAVFFGLGFATILVVPFPLLIRLQPKGSAALFAGIDTMIISTSQFLAAGTYGLVVAWTGDYRSIFPLSLVVLTAAAISASRMRVPPPDRDSSVFAVVPE